MNLIFRLSFLQKEKKIQISVHLIFMQWCRKKGLINFRKYCQYRPYLMFLHFRLFVRILRLWRKLPQRFMLQIGKFINSFLNFDVFVHYQHKTTAIFFLYWHFSLLYWRWRLKHRLAPPVLSSIIWKNIAKVC